MVEVWLLQGFHSATPRYTPAYALAAPNGAFPAKRNKKLGVFASLGFAVMPRCRRGAWILTFFKSFFLPTVLPIDRKSLPLH